MTLQQVKLAITLDDGSLSVMSFLTVGRGSVLPYGARWGTDPSSDTEEDRAKGKEAGSWVRPATDANIFEELSRTFPSIDPETKAARPQPVIYRRLADDEMPKDRTYRGAWKDVGTEPGRAQISHDMAKAREIHLELVRRARIGKLEELDREFARAAGQKFTAEDSGDKKAAAAFAAEMREVEAERQALRDLPTTIGVERALTVEDLKATWPPLLGG